jgi:hypothetical protein
MLGKVEGYEGEEAILVSTIIYSQWFTLQMRIIIGVAILVIIIIIVVSIVRASR